MMLSDSLLQAPSSMLCAVEAPWLCGSEAPVFTVVPWHGIALRAKPADLRLYADLRSPSSCCLLVSCMLSSAFLHVFNDLNVFNAFNDLVLASAPCRRP
jgi:hypothetical protein